MFLCPRIKSGGTASHYFRVASQIVPMDQVVRPASYSTTVVPSMEGRFCRLDALAGRPLYVSCHSRRRPGHFLRNRRKWPGVWVLDVLILGGIYRLLSKRPLPRHSYRRPRHLVPAKVLLVPLDSPGEPHTWRGLPAGLLVLPDRHSRSRQSGEGVRGQRRRG